jgi:hypothetical protein
MVDVGGKDIQILCGALADQVAVETEGMGLFTRALLQVLEGDEGAELLTLPFDLQQWQAALPPRLTVDKGVAILDERGILGPSRETPKAEHEQLPQLPRHEQEAMAS